MSPDSPDHWFLKKHENGDVFGPVHFDRIQEWARSAQVNALDMLSTDETRWVKAPMVPELKMDWLVVVGQNLLYGPTTAEALLEFARAGEISADTPIINCCTSENMVLRDAEFFEESRIQPGPENLSQSSGAIAPVPGTIKISLQKRVRELESMLLDRRRKLVAAEETIKRLEGKVRELEARIRDYSGLGRS